MRKSFTAVVFVPLLALSVILVAGCSVSQNAIDDVQKRVDLLKAKGVPDSSLSEAIKYVYGANYAKQKDEKSTAHRSLDSARILVAQAEALYSENLVKMKPETDSLVGVLTNAKSQFTGLQAKKIDSAMAVISNYMAKNWIYQVEDNSKKAVAMIPQLKFNEDRAKEILARLPGEWVFTDKSKSDADKAINAVEKKIFSFSKDHKAKLVEMKKGQSSKNLKEDYEFRSDGTYDCLGDTVFIFVNRFAAVRQNFETFDPAKKTWTKKAEATYDSVITDHSQDRWIPYEEMKQDFKQEKKL